MTTGANAMPDSRLGSPVAAPVEVPTMRRMYWLMRRELWEHRWLYLVPLAITVLILVGSLISAAGLPETMRAAAALLAEQQLKTIQEPYLMAALLLMGATFVVGLFYCLEALHGERRDRSILFWKSFPVSDIETVLAKASIPVVFLPLLSFVLTLAVHVVMLLVSIAVLAGSRLGGAVLWTHLPLFQLWMALLYHLLILHGLWYSPIYGWLLLVSAWSRRPPYLWAFLPLLAIGIFEKFAFNTHYLLRLLQYRFIGGPEGGEITRATMHPLAQISPGKFLGSPDLWIGVALATAFLIAAARLRRFRVPN